MQGTPFPFLANGVSAFQIAPIGMSSRKGNRFSTAKARINSEGTSTLASFLKEKYALSEKGEYELRSKHDFYTSGKTDVLPHYNRIAQYFSPAASYESGENNDACMSNIERIVLKGIGPDAPAIKVLINGEQSLGICTDMDMLLDYLINITDDGQVSAFDSESARGINADTKELLLFIRAIYRSTD